MTDEDLNVICELADTGGGLEPAWKEWSRYAQIAALSEIEIRWDALAAAPVRGAA